MPAATPSGAAFWKHASYDENRYMSRLSSLSRSRSALRFEVPARSLSAAGLSAEDRWLRLPNGGHYHYVAAGDPSKPLLVFFHGLADSWRSVAPLIPYLASDFHILALDQRGHGETGDHFDSYAPADFAADAAAFIAVLGRWPTVLIGHCMGSIVAQRIAAARPWVAKQLVLIGATDSAAENPALKELAGAILQLPDPPPVSFVRGFRAKIARSLPQAGHKDAFVADSVKLTKRVWQETVCGLLVDRQTVAEQIRMPTLVVWGESDGLFGASTQARLRAVLPRASFVSYAESGHAPHWERPELLSNSILSFLAANANARTARAHASR